MECAGGGGARLPPDWFSTVHVVSLTGGFMALAGFEPGSPDPKSNVISTTPPRRDIWVVLEVFFV